MLPDSASRVARPVVFDYRSPADFFRAMMAYHKGQDAKFSVRSRVKEHARCSPALVSQVLRANRRLTRDQLPIFGSIFSLNAVELNYLDERLLLERQPAKKSQQIRPERECGKRIPRNHLLKDWLNVYVKDACQLKGFRPEAATIHALLGGIAGVGRISRSISFLLREGFWRHDTRGRIVPDESAVFSSEGIPHAKIRQLHKQALKLAMRGLELFPVERRRASTVLVSVNKRSAEELRCLVHKFQSDLFEFIEKHPDGDEGLYQVVIHMTPIGGDKC